MARQEEIDNAKTAFYKRVLQDDYYYDPRDCFEEGAKWADEHPKSPWISVKEELPCDEKDMVIEILAGIELRTKKVLVLLEDGTIGITYMYSFPPYGWHWNINDVITHWFPIPEPPKE